MIQRAIQWLVLLFWRKPEPVMQEALPVLLEPPPLPPEPIKRRSEPRPKKPAVTEFGEFYFRGAILDDLELYFQILRRMKRADRESYDLYSRIGAHIVPHRGLFEASGLSPWWKQNRPGFGAVSFILTNRHDLDPRKMYPKFLYFRKYDPLGVPPTVQRLPGSDVYAVTVYWDEEFGGTKRGLPTEFPIAIGPDGQLTVLRVRKDIPQRMHSKRGPPELRVYTIPSARWGIDPWFKEWADEAHHDASTLLSGIFMFAANIFHGANSSMVRVDVEDSYGCHAVFGVDVTRTPYFFKDRDIEIGETGRRKKIFHIVRTHARLGGFVKTHFRGARDFVWNGYHVRITVPGLHHRSMAEMDIGAVDSPEDEPLPPHMADMKTLGEMMLKSIHH